MWAAIRAFAVGNWLKLAQWGGIALGVLTVLFKARQAGKDSEKARQYEQASKARQAMDSVPYPDNDDVVDSLRKGDF